MDAPRLHGLTVDTLLEKRSPPRALEVVGACLYGSPLARGGPAWLAWLSVPPERRRRGEGRRALAEVVARSRSDGASRLEVGGPPGNYVVTGLDARSLDARRALEARGFRAYGGHFDLVVDLGAVGSLRPAPAPAVERWEAPLDALVPWIRTRFSEAWVMEATRALAHRGLFVAMGPDGSFAGFGCHSGNLVARGTVGPLGVDPSMRGAGVGSRLARAVYADLAARGRTRFTVAWVDAATAAFWESVVPSVERVERVAMSLSLTDDGTG